MSTHTGGPADVLATVAPADLDRAGALIRQDVKSAKENLGYIRAPRTLETYRREWGYFVEWCADRGFTPLPAPFEAVALYVAHLGELRKPKGISVAVAAIAWEHRQAREESPHTHPAVKDQMESLRRKKGTRPEKKDPLTSDLLKTTVLLIPRDTRGLRDRAMLLLCFAGAFRRSELVSLNIQDLTFTDEGVRVLLRHSKTDQLGAGVIKSIPFGAGETCPVKALREWLAAASVTEGALFRSLDDLRVKRRETHPDDRLSAHYFAQIVKARGEEAGLQGEFSGHSPRSGLATSAARAGRDLLEIMDTVGWKSADVATGYIREAKSFQRNAGKGLL